jgi:C1A family cysteine protease
MNNNFKVLINSFLCALLSVMDTNSTFAAQATKVQWNAVINMPSAQINEIRAMPISKGIDLKISTDKIELKGYQNIDELRSTLFGDVIAERINFLGGPIELTMTLPPQNSPITLKLQSLITTGYGWTLDTQNSDYSLKEPMSFKMRQRGIGVPAIEIIKLKANNSKSGEVRLIYQRPFEKDAPIRTKMGIYITDTDGIIELTDPTPIKPLRYSRPSRTDMAPAVIPQVKTLPAAYDSRTLSIVPPVRNQNQCSSCWAFATVGIMEIAIAKSGGLIQDLSEQFLVSCNKHGWNCKGGDIYASIYHLNWFGIAQNAAGAVLESDKPYVATNDYCPIAYPHPYVASSFWTIGEGWPKPSVNEIKNAIVDFGAVAVTVCADIDFQNYTGGVYSSSYNHCLDGSDSPDATDHTNHPDGTNHAVVLVGWDDATQSWILRNSWGDGWGENGYMRISYDPNYTTSFIGKGANVIAVSSHTVTTSVSNGTGGSIYPSYSVVSYGSTASFDPIPNVGYVLNTTVGGTCPQGDWVVNSWDINTPPTWHTGRTTNDCNVEFSFTPITYPITAATTTNGGTVSSTTNTVQYGTTTSFTVTPNSGGWITNPTVNGNCPPGSWNGNVYTTGVITAECAVSFSFYNPSAMAIINSTLLDDETSTPNNRTFTVTPTVGAGGTVAPNTPQTVAENATQAFAATADSNYITNTTVGGTCPQGSWNSNVWTTGSIIADCTVDFGFVPQQPSFVAVTNPASDITATSAILNGNVTSNETADISFDFGTTILYDQNLAANPSIVNSSNTPVDVNASKTDLACNSVYYFRTKAVSSTNTIYGGDMNFTTAPCSTEVVCHVVSAMEGWQQFIFSTPVNEITDIRDGWSVDVVNYALVGPEGHTGAAAESLSPYNGYKYDEAYPFGALLLKTPDTEHQWINSPTIFYNSIFEVDMRINDKDEALGDNGGYLTVCFE